MVKIPNMLDLILFYIKYKQARFANRFSRCFKKLLLKGFIEINFKKALTKSLLKSYEWFSNDLSDFEFQLHNTALIMKDILNSHALNFIANSVFGKKMLNFDNVILPSSLSKILSALKKFVNLIEYSQLQFPENIESFVISGNWTLFAGILVFVESVGNCDMDVFEKNAGMFSVSHYNFLSSKINSIIFKSIFGIINIENITIKTKIINEMENTLFENLMLIENYTRKLNVGENSSKKYGLIRLGLTQRYLGLVFFLKYFIKYDKGELKLMFQKINKLKKKEFLQNLNFSKLKKNNFYQKIIRNFFFYIQRISGIKRRHEEQIIVDNFYQISKFFILFFKCLFNLDDDFQQIFKSEFKLTLMHFLSLDNVKRSERFLRKLFYFFFEITINENIFEEMFIIIKLNIMLGLKYELNNKEMSLCLNDVPGLLERIKNLLSHKSHVNLEDLGKIIKYPILESTCAPQFIEFMFEELSSFVKDSKYFKLKKKPTKIFYQNLFYLEETILNDIIIDFKNNKKKISNINWYYWNTDRNELALNFLKCEHLCQWFFDYYFQFKNKLISLKENEDLDTRCFSETDVLAELILSYFHVIKDSKKQNEFVFRIYNESGESIKPLLNSLKKTIESKNMDLNNNPLSIKNSPKKKVFEKKKLRVSRLMKRIKKKTKNISKSIILEKEESINSNRICFSCHEPIINNEDSTIIIKTHNYQPECLINGIDTSMEKNIMVTTCGHEYHLKCLDSFNDDEEDYWVSRKYNCLFCNQIGNMIIQKFDLNIKNNSFFVQAQNELNNGLLPITNIFEFISSPYLQCIKVLRIMDEGRMNNNVLPVLNAYSSILYSDHPKIKNKKIQEMIEIKYQNILQKIDLYFSFDIVNFEKLLDTICPEFLFGKFLIYSQFYEFSKTKIKFQNEVQKKQFVLQNLQNLIQRNIWKFVLLKILQKEKLKLYEINEELIISRCFDLFIVVVFLEKSLIYSESQITISSEKKFIEKIVLGNILYKII